MAGLSIVPWTARAQTASPAIPQLGPESFSATPRRPLPEIQPAPAPPGFIPPPLAPPATGQQVSGEARFVLRGVRFEGNTAIDSATLAGVAAPFLGKTVGTADLEELRRRVTVAYVERGYITSGAVLPDQRVSDGLVLFRIVEGAVTRIDVTGTKALDPDYVRDRLQRGIDRPVNIGEVERQLQLLLQDPNIARLNLELLPGVTPGEATLSANAAEAQRFSLGATVANDEPPSIGGVHGEFDGIVRNVIGRGDALGLRLGRTGGLDDGGLLWAVPVTAADTTLSARFDYNQATVLDQAFVPLNVVSTVKTIGIGITQPVYRTVERRLTLGMEIDWRDSQTTLLGMPFSFTPGVENGRARATVLRLSQDWIDRELDQVFAARSTFNVGLPMLGATVTDQPPTGRFLSWLGQMQYVRRVIGQSQLIARADVQLSHDPLFSFEQIAIGGATTVRGYRENTLVRDNAVILSLEGRIPIFDLTLPRPFGEDLHGPIELAPFADWGRGWNSELPTLRPSDISSVGLGLRWEAEQGWLAQLYYGYALRVIHQTPYDLQDSGVHFRVTARLY
ncbi:MAG TPA: POTRA domain-containing protein [Stellaceae bacterium]|nr:POTRA domain-containing protein [Stellaceae bacterium]